MSLGNEKSMNPSLTLPDPTSLESIREFAAAFDGYKYSGSFAACADAAKAKKRETLVDLRNELFFAYRAANHTGDHQILVAAYEDLRPHFERLI